MEPKPGEWLRVYRLRAGWTRDELAAALDCPIADLRAIERSDLSPQTVFWRKAATVLGLDFEDLMVPPDPEVGAGLEGSGFRSTAVGSRVRERRINLGLSRQEVAERLDWDIEGVWALEEGRAVLDLALLFAIALALETSPEALYTGTGDHPELKRLIKQGDLLMAVAGRLSEEGA